MIFLRSLLFNAAFYGWTALLAIIASPVFLTSSPALGVGRIWARGSLWLARVVCGIDYEVRGMLPQASSPALCASKHQSAWDTLIFWTLLREPAYVLKESLTRIPLFGPYLVRQRHIAIDRAAGAESLKKIIRDARARLGEGRSVIIYPEGTRTKPGAATTYQPGVAALYGQLQAPVVPVALNSGYYWGRNAFTKRPGTVVIEFLPAIAPGLKGRAFLQRLQDEVEAASARLLAEAAATR